MPEIRLDYQPHGAAKQLLTNRHPTLCISGPAGTGKTRAALFKLLVSALKYPGSRHLICRRVARSLTATTLATFREKVAQPLIQNEIIGWYGGSAQEPAQYRFKNGSKILVAGLDNPDKIMSMELDLILVDEATECTREQTEKLSSRLRNGAMPYQQLLLACNPGAVTHWINQDSKTGRLEMLNSEHQDNPTLYRDGQLTQAGATYLGRLEQLTGPRRQSLLEGKWTVAEGLVFEGWNPLKHIVDPAPIPEDWPRYWSIDFGYTNPMTVLHWAEDPDGRLILYREFVRSQMLVEDFAAWVLSVVRPDGEWAEPKPSKIVCDWDAEGRATWQRHTGLATSGAKKEVSDGIQAMAARLVSVGGSPPRLLVQADCLVDRDPKMDAKARPIGLAEEMLSYVWDSPEDEGPSKEIPTKRDDHSIDAARYMVMHFDRRKSLAVKFA